MELSIYGLILLPFIVALLQSAVRTPHIRRILTYAGSGAIIATALTVAGLWYFSGESIAVYPVEKGILTGEIVSYIGYAMLAMEICLTLLVIWLSIKHRHFFTAFLALYQTASLAYLELSGKVPHESAGMIRLDRLSLLMCLLVAVVGGLICIYALGYMKEYHHHHHEMKDRRPFFFAMLYIFLGAMFGLVLSGSLVWIYFFWEITSVVSFLLIGYTKEKRAIDNSFTALWMNLLGGAVFSFAIGYCAIRLDTVNLDAILNKTTSKLGLAVFLLAFAALTKSAQLPFSKWLLGAMVAPTPTSALLHSATMVKAGVYMLLRLAPAMCGKTSGYMVQVIGGITFLVASLLAITRSDGKRVLAWSTISNLGLITACAGVGTPETVWAGVILLIFHAVSKALLFQTVGAVEHAIGSRNIEDMHGLFRKQPALASALLIGIAGMFLAPFGMLIAKWEALTAFLNAGGISVLMVIVVAFGSATTMVYWTQWLIKLLSVPAGVEQEKDPTDRPQWLSLGAHISMMLILCATYPFYSNWFVTPMLKEMGLNAPHSLLSLADRIVMILMLAAIFLIPALAKYFTKKVHVDKSPLYMSGINEGDHRRFEDADGNPRKMYLSNWYLTDTFGEKRLYIPVAWASVVIIVIFFIITYGGSF